MKNTPTKINYKKLEPHPICASFPPLSDDEYKLLRASVAKGFNPEKPIWIYEGKILDGNNRYTACQKEKVDPVFKDYIGTDPINFVISENLARRNLTPSQQAALGAELKEMFEKQEEEEQKQEQLAALNKKGNKDDKPAPRKKSDKAAQAAKATGASKRNVEKAAALKKSSPGEFAKVKAGKKSLHAATKTADETKSKEQMKTEEYEAAVARIDKICGKGFSLVATAKKLDSKGVLKLASLDDSEMLRAKPFIEAGWTLNAALGFKSTTLSIGHTIRHGIDRAIEAGGRFILEAEAYDKQKFKITFEVVK